MTAKIHVPIDDRTMTRKTILLVEDDLDDEELTLGALRKSNIMNEVVVVRDGEEALAHLFAKSDSSDRERELLPALVLLDLNLPKLNGLDVLRRIRTHPRTRVLPVVVLTGSEAEHDSEVARDLGVLSYVHKPIDFKKIAEAVGNLGMSWVLSNEAPRFIAASAPRL